MNTQAHEYDDEDEPRGQHRHRGGPPFPEEGPMGFLLGPDGPFGPGGIFGPDGPLGAFASPPRRPGEHERPGRPGHRGPGGWADVWAAATGSQPPGSTSGGGRHGPAGRHGGGPAGHGPRGGWKEGRGPRGGGRRRRGDVRLAALLLIAEEPRNGYQVIEELAERTNGAWRPSSGAVYPALAQLEDEGLIEAFDNEGRKAFRLTEAGEEHVESLEQVPRPWDQASEHARHQRHSMGGGRESGMLWSTLGQVGMATQAVSQSGDPRVVNAATDLLERAKKDLYRLLADGADATGPAASAEGSNSQDGPGDPAESNAGRHAEGETGDRDE